MQETGILECSCLKLGLQYPETTTRGGVSLGNVKILTDFQNKYWQRQATRAAMNIVCEKEQVWAL